MYKSFTIKSANTNMLQKTLEQACKQINQEKGKLIKIISQSESESKEKVYSSSTCKSVINSMEAIALGFIYEIPDGEESDIGI